MLDFVEQRYVTRTDYEMMKARNPTGWALVGVWVFAITLLAGIWFIPQMLFDNGWVIIGVMVGCVAIIGIFNAIADNLIEQRHFDNADIHTHDDECHACAKTFGPDNVITNNDVWVCRHGTDLGRKYNRRKVLEFLYDGKHQGSRGSRSDTVDNSPDPEVTYDRKAVREMLGIE